MYFHVTTLDLQPRDIINPGHWGSQIRQYRPGGPMPSAEHFHVVLWEVAMEAARVGTDQGLPSRLDCVFVTETQAMAESFRDKYREGAFIYEVSPLLADLRTHRGDFALISDGIRHGSYADYMAEHCRQYWADPAVKEPEILYPGPLQVTRRI